MALTTVLSEILIKYYEKRRQATNMERLSERNCR